VFRYLALIWDNAADSQREAATSFSRRIRSIPRWHCALDRIGLQVFATDGHAGANRAAPIEGDRGVVLGRLFSRQATPSRPTAEHGTTELDERQVILTAGDSLVERHWGRWVAFFPGPIGTASVLRDPSGALPCYYLRRQGVWIVFSWLEDVLEALPDQPLPQVDWSALAAFLQNGESSGSATTLAGVSRVLPGERVVLGHEQPRSELVWDPVRVASRPFDLDPGTTGRMLRETVRACTSAWASGHERILLRLSGGIDSSILATCLADDSIAARVTCINYHSRGADGDERSYARAVAARCRLELIERERNSAFDLARVLTMARTPNPVLYVGRIASQTDAEIASIHGASALFTGAGGDTVFFEYGNSWPAADYLRHRGLDRGFWRVAMDSALLGGQSVWVAIAQAIKDRFRRDLPAPEAISHPSLIRLPVDASRPPRLDERFVHRALLSGPGLPIGKLTQVRHLVHPIGFYDPLTLDQAPEVVHPLLSQPVIELCLRIPTYELTRGGRGRALARQSFAHALPAEVTHRRAKGGMEEFSTAVLMNNRALARSLLLDGQLGRRGFIDVARVERALADRPEGFHVHVGEIHRLIAIEAWLSHWTGQDMPAARRPRTADL